MNQQIELPDFNALSILELWELGDFYFAKCETPKLPRRDKKELIKTYNQIAKEVNTRNNYKTLIYL